MCVVEREIYVQLTGARQIIETERPCRNATATRLCNKVDYRLVQKSYTGLNMPSPRRDRHDDLIVTEGRDGTERVYREITGRHRRRNSRTSRHSASSSGTPISSEDSLSVSSPSRYSTVEVKPAAVSPRIRSWDLPQRDRTPDRRVNQGHRSKTPEDKNTSDFSPFQKNPRVATNERIKPPNNSERTHRTSNPNHISPPKSPPHTDTKPLRSSLKPQTELKIPSPMTSPIIASPGLSNLPELRHRRDDSAKGFVFSKESSPGTSAQSDRSSRRSVVGGQHVRFEEDILVGSKERDEGSRAWSERSGERGDRYRGVNAHELKGRRGSGGGEEGVSERQQKLPVAGPGGQVSSANEREDSIERRDRHRRRAEDALNGRSRSTWEGIADSEPRKLARERSAGEDFEREGRAVQKGLGSLRSSLRTAERSPISPSSKSKSSASSPRTSRPTRRVTIHQYRYGENMQDGSVIARDA